MVRTYDLIVTEMFGHSHSGLGEGPGVKHHSGSALFTHTVNEPGDFPSIYRKLISAWGLYHYQAFKGATNKMTNSAHWRHFPGSKQCGRTCCPGSFASITANQILGHLWLPVHGWEGQELPLDLSKCAEPGHLVHPTDAPP